MDKQKARLMEACTDAINNSPAITQLMEEFGEQGIVVSDLTLVATLEHARRPVPKLAPQSDAYVEWLERLYSLPDRRSE